MGEDFSFLIRVFAQKHNDGWNYFLGNPEHVLEKK